MGTVPSAPTSDTAPPIKSVAAAATRKSITIRFARYCSPIPDCQTLRLPAFRIDCFLSPHRPIRRRCNMNTATTTPNRRTIRRQQLREMVPLADSSIYEMELRGVFPRRFALTPRCVVWDLSEVQAWLAARRSKPITRAPGPDVKQRRSRPVKGLDLAPKAASTGMSVGTYFLPSAQANRCPNHALAASNASPSPPKSALKFQPTENVSSSSSRPANTSPTTWPEPFNQPAPY